MRPSTFLWLALLAGCVSVHATTMPGANLDQFKTFAWYEPDTLPRRQRELQQSPAGDVIRARITRDLAAKGIHQTRGAPDFFVLYRLQREQAFDVSVQPRLYSGQPGAVRINDWTQGNLVVEFIDPRSGEVFWRGVAEAVLDRPASPNLDKLADAVDKVMKRYPMEVATSGAAPAM